MRNMSVSCKNRVSLIKKSSIRRELYMRRYQSEEVPDGTKQMCPPSLWPGIEVTRYIVPSCDSDYFFKSILNFSLVINPPSSLYNYKWGNWNKIEVNSGAIVAHPFDYQERIKWEGDFEAINVVIDQNWIFDCNNSNSFNINLLPKEKSVLHDIVLTKLIQDIEKDSCAGMPVGPTYTEALVFSFLHRYAAIRELKFGFGKKENNNVAIGRAVDYIHSNLDQCLSIEEIVKASGFEGSLYSFVRVFKKKLNENPHRYVLNARLKMARELIEKEEASITEVALICGFLNLSHFSDTFKKYWGISPSNIRSHKNEMLISRKDKI